VATDPPTHQFQVVSDVRAECDFDDVIDAVRSKGSRLVN
jgi:hypothetical protein